MALLARCCQAPVTGSEAHGILVSRPMFTSGCATGRSIDGYWWVECKSGEVVFVQDIWRTDAPGADTEGSILKGFLNAGVQNIPGPTCHGDVVQGVEAAFPVYVEFEISFHGIIEDTSTLFSHCTNPPLNTTILRPQWMHARKPGHFIKTPALAVWYFINCLADDQVAAFSYSIPQRQSRRSLTLPPCPESIRMSP